EYDQTPAGFVRDVHITVVDRPYGSSGCPARGRPRLDTEIGSSLAETTQVPERILAQVVDSLFSILAGSTRTGLRGQLTRR
ncbi:MAG TPA: hypothetical protein VGL80_28690, partial [Pseudonocardiaceae bacterium]